MTSQGPFWPTMMRWTLGKWNSIFGIALFVCFPSRQMWKGKWTVNNIWMLIITSSVYVRHPFSLGCSFKMANSGDLCPKMDSRTLVNHMTTSGDNLLKNRPRASTSKYKQLPINLRLFQNTVKFSLQESRNPNIAITHLNMLPVPMLDKDCQKSGKMEFEESESEWFQMYPGTF